MRILLNQFVIYGQVCMQTGIRESLTGHDKCFY